MKNIKRFFFATYATCFYDIFNIFSLLFDMSAVSVRLMSSKHICIKWRRYEWKMWIECKWGNKKSVRQSYAHSQKIRDTNFTALLIFTSQSQRD